MRTAANANRLRRLFEVLCFVAVWMAIGWSIRPLLARGTDLAEDPFTNLYLLLGIPLTVFFQVVLRRQPLWALWVRDAPPLRLGKTGVCLALGLMILPAAGMLLDLSEGKVLLGVREALVLPGAIGAAYALCNFRRSTLQQLALCLAIVTVIDVAVSIGMHQMFPDLRPFLAPTWKLVFLVLLATVYYLPVCFVLEEVTFRGALDAHLHRPGEAYAWPTAFLISALWGLWHLPIAYPGDTPLLTLTAVFLVVHVTVGVPLSFYWRRSGNLAIPALAHGFIDALRDVLNVV